MVSTLIYRGAQTMVLVDVDGLVQEAEVANVHGEPPAWPTAASTVAVQMAPSALRLLPAGG